MAGRRGRRALSKAASPPLPAVARRANEGETAKEGVCGAASSAPSSLKAGLSNPSTSILSSSEVMVVAVVLIAGRCMVLYFLFSTAERRACFFFFLNARERERLRFKKRKEKTSRFANAAIRFLPSLSAFRERGTLSLFSLDGRRYKMS